MNFSHKSMVVKCLFFGLLCFPSHLWAIDWEPVTGGRYLTVSGIALVPKGSIEQKEGEPKKQEGTQFLVVHDAKGRNIVTALITMNGSRLENYEAVDWYDSDGNNLLQDQPKDLEALTALPYDKNDTGKGPEFLAVTSEGTPYKIEIVRKFKKFLVAKVQSQDWKFTKPGENKKDEELEGVAIQTINKREILAWGRRGKNENVAKVCWVPISFSSNVGPSIIIKPMVLIDGKVKEGNENCKEVKKSEIEALGLGKPNYCSGNCEWRGITDLKVDTDGNLYFVTTNTIEPDDDGPFDSSLIKAGKFSFKDMNLDYKVEKFQIVAKHLPHKVEALELLGKDKPYVLGADDENLGGFLTYFKPESVEEKKLKMVSPYVVKGTSPLKLSVVDNSEINTYQTIELSARPLKSPKSEWLPPLKVRSDGESLRWDGNLEKCKKKGEEKYILCLNFDQIESKWKEAGFPQEDAVELEVKIQGIPKAGADGKKPSIDLLDGTRKTIVYFKSDKGLKLQLLEPVIKVSSKNRGEVIVNGEIRVKLPLPENKHELFFKSFPDLEKEVYNSEVRNLGRVTLRIQSLSTGNGFMVNPRLDRYSQSYYVLVVSNDDIKKGLQTVIYSLRENKSEEFKIFLYYPGQMDSEGLEVLGNLLIFKD